MALDRRKPDRLRHLLNHLPFPLTPALAYGDRETRREGAGQDYGRICRVRSAKRSRHPPTPALTECGIACRRFRITLEARRLAQSVLPAAPNLRWASKPVLDRNTATRPVGGSRPPTFRAKQSDKRSQWICILGGKHVASRVASGCGLRFAAFGLEVG